MNNAAPSTQSYDWTESLLTLPLRTQWEWVAGKEKYVLSCEGDDGECDPAFVIIIRGPVYTGNGWEVLLCVPMGKIVVCSNTTLDGAMRLGEALYLSHYSDTFLPHLGG